MKLFTVILIAISIVAVIGALIGFQQIVTWQAQVAFEQYNSGIQSKVNETPVIEEPHLPQCIGSARCITGIVTEVIDGDTIKVDEQSIRFALASAPELSDPEGIIAKDFIDGMCPIGSTAIVDEDDGQTKGSYDRILGVIYCNGKNLNEQLVESGYGYLSKEFCSVSEFSNNTWAKKYGC
ncbi:MAG: thermonuclease family protein [Nitrosarchaeum sp.]|nr:thermonuclease family protein [Nitrosarchaeum sp.]